MVNRNPIFTGCVAWNVDWFFNTLFLWLQIKVLFSVEKSRENIHNLSADKYLNVKLKSRDIENF